MFCYAAKISYKRDIRHTRQGPGVQYLPRLDFSGFLGIKRSSTQQRLNSFLESQTLNQA